MNNPKTGTGGRDRQKSRPEPWVQLRSSAFHPFIYKRMVEEASPGAKSGDLVAVYDRGGDRFGSGFFNPQSQIALRMLAFDDRAVDEDYFSSLFESAIRLRHDDLRIQEVSEAYRLIFSEGDGLSGLIVDRFDDVLSVEVMSHGVYRHLGPWLKRLHELAGTKRHHVHVDETVARREGFRPVAGEYGEGVSSVRIRENGVRFAVAFETGHKTGFFCDQRENRLFFSKLARGRSVLDLCSYTGGFSIYASVLGECEDVTGVDLDEKAIDQARHNANLNQSRVSWVHSDAFAYARQMKRNDRKWDAVVLDPSKFIHSRDEDEISEGKKKYHDLNTLAISLVARGGLFVTCSCSGLLEREEFGILVARAAHRQGRRLQVLQESGAAPDHPVLSNCPESRYLKVIWARVL